MFFPKFIIEDGDLILAMVTFHKEMVSNKAGVKGGGWFRYKNEDKSFTLFGDSHDFGKAKLEDIMECIRTKRVYSDKFRVRELLPKFKFYYDDGFTVTELTV